MFNIVIKTLMVSSISMIIVSFYSFNSIVTSKLEKKHNKAKQQILLYKMLQNEISLNKHSKILFNKPLIVNNLTDTPTSLLFSSDKLMKLNGLIYLKELNLSTVKKLSLEHIDKPGKSNSREKLLVIKYNLDDKHTKTSRVSVNNKQSRTNKYKSRINFCLNDNSITIFNSSANINNSTISGSIALIYYYCVQHDSTVIYKQNYNNKPEQLAVSCELLTNILSALV